MQPSVVYRVQVTGYKLIRVYPQVSVSISGPAPSPPNRCMDEWLGYTTAHRPGAGVPHPSVARTNGCGRWHSVVLAANTVNNSVPEPYR